MSSRITLSLPARFVAVGTIAFLAGRATNPEPRGADATERAPLRASHRVIGDRELVDLELVVPLATNGDEAIEISRDAFAIAGASVARVDVTSASAITLTPSASLPRARRFEVEVREDLARADGGRIAAGSRFPFTTPGPRVVEALPSHLEDDGRLTFRLAFDLPIALASLDSALSVRSPDGTLLPRSIARAPDPDDGVMISSRYPGLEAANDGVTSAGFLVTIENVSGAPPADHVEVRLDSSLRSTVGPMTITGERRFGIDFASPLAVEGVEVTADSIAIDFGFSLDAIDPSLVSLEPTTPFRITRSWSGRIVLEAALEPGARYVATLAKGFPGHGFARLKESVRLPVNVPDREPHVEFEDRAIVLSTHARPEVTVSGVNVSALTVRGKRVLDHNAVHFLRQRNDSWRGDPDAAFSGPWAESVVPIVAAENEEFRHAIDLEAILGPSPRGLFLIEAAPERRAYATSRVLIAITDLRATLRIDGDRALACVSSVATGQPIAAARVEVYSRSNRRLAVGTTDERGIVLLSCPSEAGDQPFCVLAGAGDDRTFVDLDHFALTDESDDEFRREFVSRGEREAFVSSDRPVLRPGERATFAVVLRDSLLRAAPGAFLMRCFDGAENQRDERRIEAPSSGLASFEIETQETDPTGIWRVEIVEPESLSTIGAASFQVASVALPRIEVAAAIAPDPLLGGRAIVEISARWLTGVALARAGAVVSARLDPISSSLGEDGFETRSAPFFGRALPIVETTLDAEGNARVELDLPEPGRLDGAQDAMLRVVVEVTEPDGRVVERRVESATKARDPRLALKRDGESIAIQLVESAGSPAVEGRVVEIEIATIEWVWKRDRRGGFAPVSERITAETCAVPIVDGVGRFRPRLTLDRSGLVATARYLDRRVDLELSGDAAAPDRLILSGPDAPIARGASFPLTIDSPVAGDVVLSIEGAGIHSADRFTVPAGRSERQVVLPDSELPPNLRVVATLARPQLEVGAETGAAILLGATSVSVAVGGRAEEATLVAPEVVLPGSTFPVTIVAPGAEEALVAVVDAGALFGVAKPFGDPLEFFTAPRRTTVVAADSAVSLRRDARFVVPSRPGGDAPADVLAAAIEGGGEDEAVLAITRRVRLDSTGSATMNIDLEEFDSFEGRLELVALAAGPDRFSTGRTSSVVRAPLSLRLSGPRLLRGGDTSEFTLVIRNDSDDSDEFALEVSCDGPLSLPISIAPNVNIRAGMAETMVIPVVADSDLRTAQSAGMRVSVRGRSAERAVVRACRVAPRDPIVTRRESWTIVDPMSASRRVGAGMRGVASVRIELSSRPEARLAAALATLMDYPYGCTEQVASQLLATMSGAGLDTEVPDGAERGDSAEFVAVGLHRIVAAQRGSGAFSFWPRSGSGDPLPTLHAAEALLVASELGFATPQGAIDAAVRWLADRGARFDDAVVAATSAELVGRSGRPLPRAARDAATSASREARARAALALARSGDRVAALAALRFEPGPGREPPRSALGVSDRRAAAIELRAWLAAAPGDPRTHELASRLLDDLESPESWTTNELAHGLLAAREYFRAYAPTNRPANVEIVCGESRRTFAIPSERIDWSIEVAPGAIVEVHSDGPLFGRITTVGRAVESAASSCPDLDLAREIRGLVDDLPLLPGEGLRRGSAYRAVIRIDAARDLGPVVIVDPLAAGCEPERVIQVASGSRSDHESAGEPPSRIELRDGVALIFFDRLPVGRHEIRYVFRATTRGEYARPRTRASVMYETGVVAETADDEVSVRR